MRIIAKISSFLDADKKRSDTPVMRHFSDDKDGVVVLFDNFVDADGVIQSDLPARRLTFSGSLTKEHLESLKIGDPVAVTI